jgi:hypothetical protein
LDCTSFSSSSEVPLQWIKYCAELIYVRALPKHGFGTPTPKCRNISGDCTTYQQASERTILDRQPTIHCPGTSFCGEIRIYPTADLLSHQVPDQAIAPLSYAGEFPLFQDLPSIGNFFSSRIGEGKPSNVRRYYDEGWVHTDARHFRSCATHLRITSVCNLHYTLDLPMTVPLCSEDACVTGATTTFTLHRSSVFAGSRAFAIQSYGVLFRGITK